MFDISSILTQVSNYSLSIVKLIEHGLDLQAKVLLRSMFEVINNLIIITSKEEMMKKYCEGVDEYTSNLVWSNTFRPKQVKNLLSKIEYDLGLREEKELLQFLKQEKENTYRFLSSITHGSYYSNILGSYSQFKDEEFMPLALFGAYTDASIPSLQQLNWQIFYLTIMLNAIKQRIHRSESPKTNQDLYKTCELLKSIFINTYFRYIDVKEQEK